MPKLALSYRRADSDAITGRIFDRLQARYGRDSVFRDIDNIPVGVDFRAHIDAVLDNSDVVLVIVGPRWMGGRGTQNRLANPADPVRIEVETALRKGRPIIPVLVGRTGMPKVEQLPESLVDFAYRNGVRVDTGQDFDLHVDRLVRAIDGILGTDSARYRETAVYGTKGSGKQSARLVNFLLALVTRRRIRLVWAAGGTVLLIAACLILWVVTRGPGRGPDVPGPRSTRPSTGPTRQDDDKKPRGDPATRVLVPYRELGRDKQPEGRDPTGKVTVEAATIHVLYCDGPGGNQAQIYLYEYLHRPAFRAINPPNWGSALGGRDFSRFEDAARVGCGAPPVPAATALTRVSAPVIGRFAAALLGTWCEERDGRLLNPAVIVNAGGIFAEDFFPTTHMNVERTGDDIHMFVENSDLYPRVQYLLKDGNRLEGIINGSVHTYVRCRPAD